jgi:hypothetical protein
MASLQQVQAFLNIEIGDKRLHDGKKYKNKNQYYYYEQAYYIIKLSQDKWMVAEDCRKTRVLLRKHCWSVNGGYATTNATTNVDRSPKYWHQLYFNYEAGLVADHINNKRYDNRIDNIRIVTARENNLNRTKQSNNTSGKQGVNRWTHKKTGLNYWRVQIVNNNGKTIEKVFSIKKLGGDEAKRQAIEHRKQLELQFGYIGD